MASDRPKPKDTKTPLEPEAPPEETTPLGRETGELTESATEVGQRRLQRPLTGEAITALIGGLSVSFGAVAMGLAGGLTRQFAGPSAGLLAASLAFPVGFVILLIGKSELFTENFLLPVIGVFERRGTPLNLVRVWGISLVFNLAGAFIFAWLIARPGVLNPFAAADIRSIAAEKISNPFWIAFTKAIFAGWLMTILTWLMLACTTVGQRLAIIWMIGTLIILGDFNHSVISASETFIAINLGAKITYAQWFLKNLVPAVFGNLVGGVLFVTSLFYLQRNALDRGRTLFGDHQEEQ